MKWQKIRVKAFFGVLLRPHLTRAQKETQIPPKHPNSFLRKILAPKYEIGNSSNNHLDLVYYVRERIRVHAELKLWNKIMKRFSDLPSCWMELISAPPQFIEIEITCQRGGAPNLEIGPWFPVNPLICPRPFLVLNNFKQWVKLVSEIRLIGNFFYC